jgi:hypothetical protein
VGFVLKSSSSSFIFFEFLSPKLSLASRTMSTPRQYDIVVFGATGYTGKLTAEHITAELPTDLKWALAGRSASKLEAVAADCKAINPDRIQPGQPFVPLLIIANHVILNI